MTAISDLQLTGVQLRYEQKAFWRNPAAAFFAFAFPLVIFVLFGALFTGKESSLGGVKAIVYYTPTIMAYGIMSACFTSLAISITFRREQGLLKRIRSTPLPPTVYLGAIIANAIIVALIIAVLIIAIGILGYGANAPHDWPALIITAIVGAATFCALGLAITTVIPNADAAPGIVNIIFFVLIVISGGFFPIANTSTLTKIAEIFPLYHFIKAAYAAFDPRHTNTPFPTGHILIIAAWGALALLTATRYFQWDAKRN